MFQTNQGPSFPAHQYIVSGTSTISAGSPLRAAEIPKAPNGAFTGGCDSAPGSLVTLIDADGNENQQAYPCFDRPALSDLLEAKSLTWAYYEAHGGPGFWNAFDAILHVRDGGGYRKHVLEPPEHVINDITAGHLARSPWVTPYWQIRTIPETTAPAPPGSRGSSTRSARAPIGTTPRSSSFGMTGADGTSMCRPAV